MICLRKVVQRNAAKIGFSGPTVYTVTVDLHGSRRNRHGLDRKRLDLAAYGGEKLIVPDVVVHRQGHDEQNLLVIRVKKETNNESRDYDRAVIVEMKKDYGYSLKSQ